MHHLQYDKRVWCPSCCLIVIMIILYIIKLFYSVAYYSEVFEISNSAIVKTAWILHCFFFAKVKNDNCKNTYSKVFDLESSPILKIQRVKLEDKGNYTCRVKNSFGMDAQTIFLTIASRFYKNWNCWKCSKMPGHFHTCWYFRGNCLQAKMVLLTEWAGMIFYSSADFRWFLISHWIVSRLVLYSFTLKIFLYQNLSYCKLACGHASLVQL